VDETQRNIVGGIGIAILATGLVFAYTVNRLLGILFVVIGAAGIMTGWRRPRSKDSPPPTASQIREGLVSRLIELRAKGEEIARSFSTTELVRDAPDWQGEVYDLFFASLNDTRVAQQWRALGTVDGDPAPLAGFGKSISEQVQYLSQILRDLDLLTIKDGWRP
jgi:hypothetical protein